MSYYSLVCTLKLDIVYMVVIGLDKLCILHSFKLNWSKLNVSNCVSVSSSVNCCISLSIVHSHIPNRFARISHNSLSLCQISPSKIAVKFKSIWIFCAFTFTNHELQVRSLNKEKSQCFVGKQKDRQIDFTVVGWQLYSCEGDDRFCLN